jgi:hypothetical protein
MSLTSSVQPNFLPNQFHGQEIYRPVIGTTRDVAFEHPTMLETRNAVQV